MWHPHAAPWGMQSERFNQRSLRGGGRNRVAGVRTKRERTPTRTTEFRDYSDNQRALNLRPKRAETPSALCHWRGFKAVTHYMDSNFKVDAETFQRNRELIQ
uniref:Uncharacterized protein n=1 Tax=Vespula pensylvanica TaxID=30213 RepID=A0A834PGS6_VESPE|nr:hypothetical protein H0235_001753 [Vespula pensylvanica]